MEIQMTELEQSEKTFYYLMGLIHSNQTMSQNKGILQLKPVIIRLLRLSQYDVHMQHLTRPEFISKLLDFIKAKKIPQLIINTLGLINFIIKMDAQTITIFVNHRLLELIDDLFAQRTNNALYYFGELIGQLIGNLIGTIASSSEESRDYLINQKWIQKLVAFYKHENLKNSIQELHYNFWRQPFYPSFKQYKSILALFSKTLKEQHLPKTRYLSQICRCIQFYCNSPEKIQFFVNLQIIPSLIKHLQPTPKKIRQQIAPKLNERHWRQRIICSIIGILTKISSVKSVHSKIMIQQGLLRQLLRIINDPRFSQQVCKLISFMVDSKQIVTEMIIADRKLMKEVFSLFDQRNFQVSKEIGYIFVNILEHAKPQTVLKLYRQTEIINYYLYNLDFNQNATNELILQFIFNILEYVKPKDQRLYQVFVNNFKGYFNLDAQFLDYLQNSENQSIRRWITKIVHLQLSDS